MYLAQFGETSTNSVADIHRLATHLFGYKRAYDELSEKVGLLEAELAILKTLNQDGAVSVNSADEIHRLTVDLRGFKQAYEELNQEVGQLRGFKQAYEDLNREVGQLRGYKQAYEDLNSEVGDLRSRIPSVRTNRERRAALGKPYILIATLPKSGTVFVGTTLANSLGYDYGRSLVLDGFPMNVVFPDAAEDQRCGGAITTSHVQASDWNISVLKRHGMTRYVLIVRDPRAALYSWHNYYREREIFIRRDNDEAFRNLSPDVQFERHIDGFYADALAWLTEWAERIENDNEIEVLELQYEHMVGNEEQQIRKILDFYGLGDTPVLLAEKNQATNFRTGKVDAWREVISPAVIERLNAMIPAILWKRYGWQP